MAMIDAARAQQMLGCDEATFSNYVNNGTLRSQRDGGQLLVEEKDVEALLAGGSGESSDSILVLDGESEDLSIDLGDVADDGEATMVDSTPGSQHGTDQITFGDELEVVNFDDGGTEQLDLGDDTEQTVSFDDSANTEELSFTESNTAVLTDVDDTVTSTATSDYQTVDDGAYDDDDDGGPRRSGASSVRRSVRAERVRQPAVKVSPAWMILLILTLILSAALIAPYYVVGVWPQEDKRYNNGDQAHGIDDNAWANIASTFVGFDVEPHPDTWAQTHPDAQDPHRPLNEAYPDQPNYWRYESYRGRFEKVGERAQAFMITTVEEEETADGEFRPVRAIATGAGDDTTVLGEFPMREQTEQIGDLSIGDYAPEITSGSYR